MEKKPLKKLVISRETLRELNAGETRRVIGGDGEGSVTDESYIDDCARIRIPVG